ncbi:HTH CENPB-type domain-containing protein [Mycena sanguinolenta]|uniref:HTH CENPB-type domain-containing protein n=1 Tax=Mycena sanguinolenta TaxID=230812 RepID=A0A8H6WQZ0_9AGAR|nr:HTH CENPB-type domain-containing protein [Mycena sanguinolenta]
MARAKSKSKHAQIAREERDTLMARAVVFYRHEVEKDLAPEKKRMSLRTVCRKFEGAYKIDTGRDVALDHNTLLRLVKGGKSKSLSNEEQGWLLPEEVRTVIAFAKDVANRGFPLNHKRLKEAVDEICRARLGDRFPACGVGKNWTGRFLEKYHDELWMYWSHSLDNKRGRAVNPATNTAWFDLLENVLAGRCDHEFEPAPSEEDREDRELDYERILPENIYGMDESGFPASFARKEKVIGGAGKKTQHKRGDGSRENTTVIVTICADGSALKPAVIFKGQAYNVRWEQENPTEASLGYSKKGWVDGEINVEFMKDFHEQTKKKAKGRTRLVVVDGHNSHYSKPLLDFARKHRIHVLCYPAHATHIYQGLDVVVFGPLKLYWSEEKSKHEREKREAVTKENFLAIYGAAHIRALTAETIQAAFRKTGLWPFNREVVTEEMMAPSLETAARGHLPVAPSTPVRIMTDMLHQAHQRAKKARIEPASDAEDEGDAPASPTPQGNNPSPPRRRRLPARNPFDTPVRNAISRLGSTSSAFLVSSSPIQSSSDPPANPTAEISPEKAADIFLLAAEPSTALERDLQVALRKAHEKNRHQKHRIIEMQSALVLNGAYVDAVRGQLAAQEKKRARGNKKGRLVGDGLPRLLTARDFVNRVAEFERDAAAKAEELQKRKANREERGEALKRWKELDDQRKERNKEVRREHAIQLLAWEAERDLAKQQHRRPGWKKPTLKGLLFSPLPKPGYALTPGEKAVESDEDKAKSGSDSDSDSDSSPSASDSDQDE